MIVHFLTKSAADFIAGAEPTEHSYQPSVATREQRLAAAINWIARSIDVCGGKGSSKGYRFLRGWMPAYPETSGYIIPTLLMLARERRAPRFRERAETIGDWLIGLQLPNGGFCGGALGSSQTPVVFDTGMILLGFNALLHDDGQARYREAARRAAQFLVSAMDDSGGFVRHLDHDIPHTYNVRAAWGLVGYGELTGETGFVEAGLANARWTLAQQRDNGWFENNIFKPGGNANTHGIAYVLRGLLQIHQLTDRGEFLESVTLAAEKLRALYLHKKWLAAEIGPNWEFLSRHVCLTGYAQLAILFFRLFRLTGKQDYFDVAVRLVDDVARRQDLSSQSRPHFGAIPGSFPIYGRYAPLQYPNWATKFFIDALLAEKQATSGAPGERNPLQLYAG